MTNHTAPDTLGREFRVAMARVCTPVTVVTAFDHERPHGTTVSAFMSLSMTPSLIAVALDKDSDLLAIARSTLQFGVNVLGVGQESLALTFAKKGPDKFGGVDWRRDCGLPRLDGAPVWLRCSVADVLPAGDHSLLTGSVLEVEHGDVPPLTYHDRTFGTHVPVSASAEGRPRSVT